MNANDRPWTENLSSPILNASQFQMRLIKRDRLEFIRHFDLTRARQVVTTDLRDSNRTSP